MFSLLTKLHRSELSWTPVHALKFKSCNNFSRFGMLTSRCPSPEFSVVFKWSRILSNIFELSPPWECPWPWSSQLTIALSNTIPVITLKNIFSFLSSSLVSFERCRKFKKNVLHTYTHRGNIKSTISSACACIMHKA